MNWMKYKSVYLLISLVIIAVGVFSLFKWGLNLGVDFEGGTIAEYKLEHQLSTEDVANKLKEAQIEVSSVQATDENQLLIKSKNFVFYR